MNVSRVVPNICTNRFKESIEFYTSLFGFHVAMDMDWIVTLASPENPKAQISLVRSEREPCRGDDPLLSLEVSDVDHVHSEAVARGYGIVYPLTDEPWGVRRFFLKDPSGLVINVLSHIQEAG
ncbi:VOC family protein [bacterium]|nr:VOC family protein [bacterium]